MMQITRRKAFWFYDRLRGSKVKNHLRDVDSILSKNSNNANTKWQGYLSKLLSHAANTTAYYADLKDVNSIQEYPIINKNIIRDNYGQFISNDFEQDELKSQVTSGSTGTPFKILQNQNKILRNTADTLYFSNLAGYQLGQRLYYLKIWNELNKKNAFATFAQNVVPIDVMDQSETFFKELVQDLNKDKTPKSFLGYASAFESLCKYLDSTKIERVSSNVKAIISMAEALNSYTKKSMKTYFGCEAVSRYSNTENGILAQQKKGADEKFYLNTASYFFEILAVNKNEHVSKGIPGRIVVTDLFNYGMPMIRYDTGDVGVLDSTESGELVLSKIEGRKMDMIYDTNGELVSSFVITNNMWKYTDIKQYQFIQESVNNYYFKINPKNKFDRENELINEFKEYFGRDAEIRVEYVSEIPLLSSGKRRKVVNKMDK